MKLMIKLQKKGRWLINMASYTIELRKVCEYYGRDVVESWFKSYKLEDALTPEQIEAITKYNVWSKEKLASMIFHKFKEDGCVIDTFDANKPKAKKMPCVISAVILVPKGKNKDDYLMELRDIPGVISVDDM